MFKHPRDAERERRLEEITENRLREHAAAVRERVDHDIRQKAQEPRRWAIEKAIAVGASPATLTMVADMIERYIREGAHDNHVTEEKANQYGFVKSPRVEMEEAYQSLTLSDAKKMPHEELADLANRAFYLLGSARPEKEDDKRWNVERDRWSDDFSAAFNAAKEAGDN